MLNSSKNWQHEQEQRTLTTATIIIIALYIPNFFFAKRSTSIRGFRVAKMFGNVLIHTFVTWANWVGPSLTIFAQQCGKGTSRSQNDEAVRGNNVQDEVGIITLLAFQGRYLTVFEEKKFSICWNETFGWMININGPSPSWGFFCKKWINGRYVPVDWSGHPFSLSAPLPLPQCTSDPFKISSANRILDQLLAAIPFSTRFACICTTGFSKKRVGKLSSSYFLAFQFHSFWYKIEFLKKI